MTNAWRASDVMSDDPIIFDRDRDAYQSPREARRHGLSVLSFIMAVYVVPFVLFIVLPGQVDWHLIRLVKWVYIAAIATYAWYLVMRVRNRSARDIANAHFTDSIEFSRQRNEAVLNCMVSAALFIFYAVLIL